jgi:DegV family protein with EDD domain
MKKTIDADELYHLITYAGSYLTQYKKQINNINVFPVQDKDTGNNVCATMQAIIDLSKPGTYIKETLASIADASLIGARGNSGLIYSQFFNGLIPSNDQERLTTRDFASLVMQAQKQARLAVSQPIEGTVLTLMTHWSTQCQKLADSIDDFKELFKKLISSSKLALENTINQLKVLNKHRVVDAGALSFYYFIEGLSEALHSKKKIEIPANLVADVNEHQESFDEKPAFRYCTETIFNSENLSTQHIQDIMAPHGDSIVVCGRKNKHRLHIHTNEPADFFKTLQTNGNFDYPKVEDMLKQYLNSSTKKRKMAIVTDSVADIPQGLVEDQDFYIIPVNLMLEDNVYLDKMTITCKQLYEILPKVKEYPTTSLPSNNVVKQLFNYLSSKYENILTITVSQKLSGTHDLIARVAAEYNNITVIDSKINSGAQGLLVHYAHQLKKQGLSFASIQTEINNKLSHTSIYIAVNNIKSLARSGRVPTVTAHLAKLLNIKPIISVDGKGSGIMWDKAISFKKALDKIKKQIIKQHQQSTIKYYCLMHVNADSALLQLQELAVDALGFEPDYMTEVSPAVGLHAGAGCVAIATLTESPIMAR